MPYTLSIFIDTSAFIALINSHDDNHNQARNFIETWRVKIPKYKNLVTSDYTISETISKIRYWIGNQEAIDFGTNILESQLIEIIHTTKDTFNKAWEIFKMVEETNKRQGFTTYQVKSPGTEGYFPTLSYIDAATLACIDMFKIPALFAFDQDLIYLSSKGILKEKGFLKNRELEIFP
ncbi:MAG: type II toxin-antitoxin system VapC family toxin [Candidatus Thorarchaeota archaeon]